MSLTPPPTPSRKGRGLEIATPPPLAGGGRGEGPSVTDAALRLLDVLERENTALATLDLSRAASMLAEKQDAATAFTRAWQQGPAAPAQAAALAQLGRRLDEEASRNRQLLERGIAVQGRVLALIARAVPRALAAHAPDRCSPRYGAHGSATLARMPLALSLRA